jgi:hypothetical protein
MYKKVISYEGYDGTEYKEPFYFNLSKVEIITWQAETNGGLRGKINAISESEGDISRLVLLFQDIICKSYGVRSEDGKRFVKTPEALEAFKSSKAYETLFMELATNAEAAAEFVNGIFPSDLLQEMEKQNKDSSKE